jgi:hypothetical protein
MMTRDLERWSDDFYEHLAGSLHQSPSKIFVMFNQIRVVKHKIVETSQIKRGACIENRLFETSVHPVHLQAMIRQLFGNLRAVPGPVLVVPCKNLLQNVIEELRASSLVEISVCELTQDRAEGS